MSDPASKDNQGLSPTIVGQIELICDRFEAAWRGEAKPRIEDYWQEADGPDLLRELLVLELAYRIQCHDHPEPSDYHPRFAAHANVIRAAFETVPTRHPSPGPHAPLVGNLEATAIVADQSEAIRFLAEHPGVQRFHVLRLLARGGLGEVFVARDQELHREVALKLIQERHASDPGSRSRFQFEAQVTGRLEHPGVIPVYGLGVDERGRPYYAMRFVRGESLKEAIARFHQEDGLAREAGERSLAFRELLRRFVDVCNTMAYAHGRGILHRDLKPANVMLDADGTPYITDFGLAKRTEVDSGLTRTGAIVGTPSYMPPEQARTEKQITTAADVYSLGAILYELLTVRQRYEVIGAAER
jgi:predicted Ser/Thr protein kinase